MGCLLEHATVWLVLELIRKITSGPSSLWSVPWTSLAPVHSPLAEVLQHQTLQRLAGEQDEIWEPLASARATGIPGDKYLTPARIGQEGLQEGLHGSSRPIENTNKFLQACFFYHTGEHWHCFELLGAHSLGMCCFPRANKRELANCW